MPDSKKSTSPTVRDAQRNLAGLVEKLRRLDQELADLTCAIEPQDGCSALQRTVHGTTQAVRTDLLDDAIQTLDNLTTMTEDEAIADALANDKWRGLRLVEVVQ